MHLFRWPVGLMDKVSAPRAGDCRFESWAGHRILHLHAPRTLCSRHPLALRILTRPSVGGPGKKVFGQTTNQALFSSVYLSLSLSLFISALACLARLREGIRFPAQGMFVVSDLDITAGVRGQSEAHAQTPLHKQCKRSTRAEALMPDNTLLMQAAGSQGHANLFRP